MNKTKSLTRAQIRAIVRVVNSSITDRSAHPKVHRELTRLVQAFYELRALGKDMLFAPIYAKADGTIQITKKFRQDPCPKCGYFLSHDPLCRKKR